MDTWATLLHPEDAAGFAFSVPLLNPAEPVKGYHWVVSPRGMRNGPTICHTVVAAALQLVRKLYPSACICGYMDDILVAMLQEQKLHQVMPALSNALQMAGLQIAPEKNQKTAPWKYLG